MPKIPMTGGTVPMMERLDFNRPVVDQIYSALKSAILSRELFPGQAVSENEIGQSFNSSRTPVREALSRLRDDGLIVTLPSRTRAQSERVLHHAGLAHRCTVRAIDVGVSTRSS